MKIAQIGEDIVSSDDEESLEDGKPQTDMLELAKMIRRDSCGFCFKKYFGRYTGSAISLLFFVYGMIRESINDFELYFSLRPTSEKYNMKTETYFVLLMGVYYAAIVAPIIGLEVYRIVLNSRLASAELTLDLEKADSAEVLRTKQKYEKYMNGLKYDFEFRESHLAAVIGTPIKLLIYASLLNKFRVVDDVIGWDGSLDIADIASNWWKYFTFINRASGGPQLVADLAFLTVFNSVRTLLLHPTELSIRWSYGLMNKFKTAFLCLITCCVLIAIAYGKLIGAVGMYYFYQARFLHVGGEFLEEYVPITLAGAAMSVFFVATLIEVLRKYVSGKHVAYLENKSLIDDHRAAMRKAKLTNARWTDEQKYQHGDGDEEENSTKSRAQAITVTIDPEFTGERKSPHCEVSNDPSKSRENSLNGEIELSVGSRRSRKSSKSSSRHSSREGSRINKNKSQKLKQKVEKRLRKPRRDAQDYHAAKRHILKSNGLLQSTGNTIKRSYELPNPYEPVKAPSGIRIAISFKVEQVNADFAGVFVLELAAALRIPTSRVQVIQLDQLLVEGEKFRSTFVEFTFGEDVENKYDLSARKLTEELQYQLKDNQSKLCKAFRKNILLDELDRFSLNYSINTDWRCGVCKKKKKNKKNTPRCPMCNSRPFDNGAYIQTRSVQLNINQKPFYILWILCTISAAFSLVTFFVLNKSTDWDELDDFSLDGCQVCLLDFSMSLVGLIPLALLILIAPCVRLHIFLKSSQ